MAREIGSMTALQMNAEMQSVYSRYEEFINNSDKIFEIVSANADKIKSAVLADEIVFGEVSGFEKELSINGEAVVFGVSK